MPPIVEGIEPEGFPARLRELIGSDSVSKFANEVGLGDNLIRKYLEGATPGLDKVVRICREKKIDIAWLALGRGTLEEARESHADFARRANGLREANDGREFVHLPRYDVRISAGGGAAVHSEQIVDYLSFSREWYDREIGIPPGQAALFEVHGNSMEPDLHDGDLAVIDLSKNTFKSPAIYVILEGDELRVKKVTLLPGGGVEIRSSNENYGVVTLTPEQAEQVKVLGRARRAFPRMRRLP